MKKEFHNNKTQFNIRLNEKEFEMVRELKEDFAVNISQSFKIFLGQHLAYLKKEGNKK